MRILVGLRFFTCRLMYLNSCKTFAQDLYVHTSCGLYDFLGVDVKVGDDPAAAQQR